MIHKHDVIFNENKQSQTYKAIEISHFDRSTFKELNFKLTKNYLKFKGITIRLNHSWSILKNKALILE